MGRITSFRELRVLQAAFAASMRIFDLSKTWPADERFALTGQIRRSSRSVCANIVEAWRKRRYPAAFVSKLTDAEAEASETRLWLDFALACDYLNPDRYRSLDRGYERITRQLVRMGQQADQWAVGRPTVRASPGRPVPERRSLAPDRSPAPTPQSPGPPTPEGRGLAPDRSPAPTPQSPGPPTPEERNPAPDRSPAPTSDPHVGKPPPAPRPGPRT